MEREPEIGIKPEEQALPVVVKVLQFAIPELQRRRDGGLSEDNEIGELLEVEGEEYLIVGAQTLFIQIKNRWVDERFGLKLDQTQIGDCLRSIPGAVQFNRGNGKCDRWSYLPSNLTRRPKYAVPVKFVQEYRTA